MQSLPYSELTGIKGLKVERDVGLDAFTTFRIGGRARLFLTPLSIQALEDALRVLDQAEVPFRILGNGSNLLVSDKGIRAVISLSGLSSIISFNGNLTVHAGMTIPRLLRWCLENGLEGLEYLAGIPGSLGGALFMNAGACGCAIGDYVEEILLTGPDGSFWFRPSRETFGYRMSNLPRGMIISALRIRIDACPGEADIDGHGLVPCSRKRLLQKIRQVMKKRLDTQPLNKPSAGCVFKNPEGRSAWSLIADCGLQGFRNGDAQVSEKHANFIVNCGRADFVQVRDLITIIKEKVQEQTGILLKEELVIWEDEIIH